ncbi:SGNH/GDSL hydrolase family protein [Streptomyces sp. NPDC059629]|uniref:SGNH/GDSL hydrolase family protein n=1 Tax=Streptomyces sp. NPDC059629 TaxID=3346889 RepID=UPI0036B4B029
MTALVACCALVLALVATAIAIAPTARAGAAASAGVPPHQAKQTGGALPVRAVRRVPAGDEIIDGRGDSQGWHLYAAGSGGGWAWQPLATLAPAGLDSNGERWTGRQCLTGDGRYVVAVVAPWSADNNPAGADRGGVAYVIDAHSGAVRPLVSGVSLYYFTPSCGPSDTVALTRYTGSDEQSTQLVLADAAHATVRTVLRLPGQYADAVPAPGGGFLATAGNTVVAVSSAGRLTVRARAAGRPFDLVANAAGGVDYLVGAGRSSASVWRWDAAGVRRVGDGVFNRLALYEGRDGHTVAAGTTRLDPAAGIVALPSQATPTEAASLDGTAYSPVPAQARRRPATVSGTLPGTPLLLAGPGRDDSWTPSVAAPRSALLPAPLHDNDTPATLHSRTFTHATTSTATACAVARNDVHLQAMQPSPHDVDWAANLAGRSLLTGSAARPADYGNLGLSAYSPSADFPLPAPFGSGAKSIPREVLEGVFAQESNFNQATWHAVQGVAGNPMIADYYGAGGGYVVGAATPDCGYGLGQITTGMHTGETLYDLQRKVAVDYAENAAAAARLLAQKWNQLAAAGITANSADPSLLENWYLALWAYNSGLHADTGSGPWGLGWANNPANPDYPYNRRTFLHEDISSAYKVTYEDAETPADWPYQEKVFGWMEVPIRSPLTWTASYEGTIQTFGNAERDGAYELTRPGNTAFCTVAGNQCDPTVCNRAANGSHCDPATRDGNGPCTRSDFECWWHSPVSWCTTAAPCHTGTWEYDAGAAEPPAQSGDYYPLPTCSVSTTDIPAGTDIVDTQTDAVNLQGCTADTMNWRNSGSFAFSYGDPGIPTSQKTDMDVHQVGTGLGGHMWFTHTDEPTDDKGVSLWGVTGTWTPDIAPGRYQVKVFVPAAGATATEATYTISNAYGPVGVVKINQKPYADKWITLGAYWLGPGANVSLTNLHTTSSGDLAFSGMAFVPAHRGTYAMLGDSYSAGEGAGDNNYDQETDNYSTPAGINNGHRSPYAYNRAFASNSTTFVSRDSWIDVACSGAVILDFYQTNQTGKCPNEKGQQTALNADTSLVTLTFGGNDLGFADVMKDCVDIGYKQWFLGIPLGTTCQQKDGATVQADITALTDPSSLSGLPKLYEAIRAAAPNAQVVVLGYPHLFTGTLTDLSGRCIRNGWILYSDQDWLNKVADEIDSDIERAAQEAGFGYVSTTAAFDGHELCSSSPWFTGILDPNTLETYAGFTNYLSVTKDSVQQQFFHPNIAGYRREADMLANFLDLP